MANEKTTVLTVDTGRAINSVKEYKAYLDELRGTLLGLTEDSEEYNAVAKQLRDAQDKLNRVMKVGKGYADAAEGSYNHLVETMKNLKTQWRATADEAERAELGQKILSINDQLKEMDASIGNYQRNVGNYQNAFEEAFKVILRGINTNSSAIGNLGGSIIRLIPLIKKTTQAATAGLKGIKAAIASTGIGLLVTGLGLIVTHWKDIWGWASKTVPALRKVREENELIEASLKRQKTLIEDNSSLIQQELRLMAAAGATQLEQAQAALEAAKRAEDELYEKINNRRNWLSIYETAPGLPASEIKAKRKELEEWEKMAEELSNATRNAQKDLDVATAAARAAAQTIADEAAFALLSSTEQLKANYEKQKAELEKWGIDTTSLTKKYLKDLQDLRNKAGAAVKDVKISPFEIDLDPGELKKAEENVLNYLEWFRSEYNLTSEEIIAYRIQKEKEAIEEAKNADIKAANEAKDEYQKNLYARLKAGEVTQKEYADAVTSAEIELRTALEAIDERYITLVKEFEVKSALEASVEMKKIYERWAQDAYQSLNNTWSKSYEKYMYDYRRMVDAITALDKKYARGFKNPYSGLQDYIESVLDGFDRLHKAEEEGFNILAERYNSVTGEKVFISLAKATEKEMGDVLRAAGVQFGDYIKEIRRNAEGLYDIVDNTGKVVAQAARRWAEDGHFVKVFKDGSSELEGLSRALDELYRKMEVPPEDFSNFFVDEIAADWYDMLVENSNRIYKMRKNEYDQVLEYLEEERKLIEEQDDLLLKQYDDSLEAEKKMYEVKKKAAELKISDLESELGNWKEGSIEWIIINRNLSAAREELSDIETQHIVNNEQFLDDYKQKSTEANESRLSVEKMISDVKQEISDLETEHQLENLDLIDQKEETLAENREKRIQYWQDMVSGVSTTLDNLGTIFQNELKAEVEAGKMSEETARERFESLKALNYAAVTMDTASAIMAAWKGAMEMPQPAGSIWGAVQTAALVSQGILQLQQIKQQQFGSTSSTSAIAASPVQADYTPQYTANMTNQTELTELTNAINRRKLYVSVTDIEDVQKTVSAREEESTY